MEFVDPRQIEQKSMEIIEDNISELDLAGREKKIIKRVVHATAEPALARLVQIGPGALDKALELLKEEPGLVTDVNMLKAGISQRKVDELNLNVSCFIARSDIKKQAEKQGITRSMMSMHRAVQDDRNCIFVIGNAPTALFELLRLREEGRADRVEFVVGTPVGFVGASEAKEKLTESDLPYITVSGRRGGSPVAASIVNALLYML